MKLVQLTAGESERCLGAVTGEGLILDLTAAGGPADLRQLIAGTDGPGELGSRLAALQGAAEPLGDVTFAEMASQGWSNQWRIGLPVDAPEIWGFAGTYLDEAGLPVAAAVSELYDRAACAGRPVLYYKASAARCSAAWEPVSIRSDANLSFALPELALVVGHAGRVIGYTVANNVSAADVERANPLHLAQSRVFIGGSALGPLLVTADEIGDVRNLSIAMKIERKRKVIFDESTTTAHMKWTIEELVDQLLRDNVIPPGSVVMTGSGILAPDTLPLQHGDIVRIAIDRIGTLCNPVQKLLA